MILVTTDDIAGYEITEVRGYAKGSTVRAKNVGHDIIASLKTLVGGEIKEYTKMIDESRQIAIGRMIEDAKDLGADAVVCMRFSSSTVMAGASELMAYGTAVKIIKK
jgi:uncharacterized protein YbjQ (UPF0145 family)